MVGAEGPPLGGRLKPRTARPRRRRGRPQKHHKISFKASKITLLLGLNKAFPCLVFNFYVFNCMKKNTRTLSRWGLYWSLVCLAFSCQKTDVEVPAYIYVPAFTLQVQPEQGSASHNIRDAWISVEGQSIGANNTPVRLPVILSNGEGNYTVRVGAGIENNGLANMRSIYPFYTRHEERRYLKPGQIDTIYPVIEYDPLAQVRVLEDFEGPGVVFALDLDGDTMSYIRKSQTERFEGNYVGELVLSAGLAVVGTSVRYSNLQRVGTAFPVYLEFNYKNNLPFDIGVISYFDNGTEIVDYVSGVNPRNTWNKLYVDLTGVVFRNNAAQYGIVFRFFKPSDAEETRVYFDNIKLLYFN